MIRKSRAPCGIEADSPADNVKVLQKHFQNFLSAAPPNVDKEVNQTFIQLPIAETNCVAVFIDYSKAFDSISRGMRKKIFSAYGIPEKVVDMIMRLYNGSKDVMITEISAGVLQGDTLAPFLFVIIVDWVMRNAT